MLDQLSPDQFTLIFCGTVIGISAVAAVINVLFLKWIWRRIFPADLIDFWLDSED